MRALRLARAARGAAALALGCGAAACDPCDGALGCEVAPQVSYTGRVVEVSTGRPAAGVTVVFRRDGGTALAADSLVAVTDREGRFRLRGDAGGSGEVIGALTVRPPSPLAPYTVADVRLTPSTVRGGGGVLPTFVTQPYVDFVGELRYRRNGGRLSWSNIVFQRTAGARLVGGDRLAGTAGADGWFFLQSGAVAGEGATVTGDLAVQTPGLPRIFTVRGVTLTVRYTDRVASLDRSFRLGATAEYVAELRLRPSGAALANADVEFLQTGGVPLAATRYTSRTDSVGRVALPLIPAGETSGEVVGDLTVRSPELRRPFVVRELRLRTYDSDELPFLGVVGIGHQAVGVGELAFRGDRRPLADAEVEFVRTGGVPIHPERPRVRTLPDGRFAVSVAADTAGVVTGELRVGWAGAPAPTVIPGVRLQAAADDSVRFLGRWGLGAQLLAVGVLTERATGRPAAGWTVTFRRVSGIALAGDSTSGLSQDWGGFAIAPDTREEGEVQGVLTARAPGSSRDVPLGPVRLRTYADDSVRLAGRWNVGPSLLYVGELLHAGDDRPVVGARVEFRRTGGIATAESLLVERSNAEGRFRLAPTPRESGTVVGDLHVFPPAPLRDTVIANVRLDTFESDEVRLRDVWRLVPPR